MSADLARELTQTLHERNELRARLAETEAAAGAMRDVLLEALCPASTTNWDEWKERARVALSSDAGRKAQAQMAAMRSALEDADALCASASGHANERGDSLTPLQVRERVRAALFPGSGRALLERMRRLEELAAAVGADLARLPAVLADAGAEVSGTLRGLPAALAEELAQTRDALSASVGAAPACDVRPALYVECRRQRNQLGACQACDKRALVPFARCTGGGRGKPCPSYRAPAGSAWAETHEDHDGGGVGHAEASKA